MNSIHAYFRSHGTEFSIGLFSFLLPIILVFGLIPNVIEDEWLPVILMPVLMLNMYYLQRSNASIRAAYFGFCLAVVAIFGFNFIRTMYSSAQTPPVWDFHCFWVYGRVASQGLNFYLPENLHAVGESLNTDETFIREVLDVGPMYPPMTMFLFSPFGALEFRSAAIAWYLLQGIVLALDIFLMVVCQELCKISSGLVSVAGTAIFLKWRLRTTA
ncbi:MAG: hypothetical protein AB1649_10470 [Chloroflexota bacterium]